MRYYLNFENLKLNYWAFQSMAYGVMMLLPKIETYIFLYFLILNLRALWPDNMVPIGKKKVVVNAHYLS